MKAKRIKSLREFITWEEVAIKQDHTDESFLQDSLGRPLMFDTVSETQAAK